MWHAVALAGLTIFLGAAPPTTILDQIVIEANAGGVEIRHPILQGSGTRMTTDRINEQLILEKTAAVPATVTLLKEDPKTFRGRKIVISLKDGSIELVEGK
jgi:hypothetical protein